MEFKPVAKTSAAPAISDGVFGLISVAYAASAAKGGRTDFPARATASVFTTSCEMVRNH